MLKGHNNIVYGGVQTVCNVIRVRRNIENLSMEMTYRTNLALQLLYFYLLLMNQYIRINPDV